MKFSNSTFNDDTFDQDPTVSCFVLSMIGIYVSVLFFLGIVFNVLNLWLFLKAKLLINPINLFMTSLIVLNLIGTFLELPLVIHSAFKCR
jgi:hypothetical protein